MMKKLFLLLTLLVLLTGCEINSIEEQNINDVIDKALKSNNSTNEIFNGYKYYLPSGMKLVDKNDYNSKILYNGDYYYLFVDIVSYYHKTELSYEEKQEYFLSKKMDYNGKKGYIEVQKKGNDSYLLKIEYNYSKIEGTISSENLNQGIYNSIKILGSVTYNDNIISSMVGENALTYEEEEFNLFESKREEGSYLDYIEEYDETENNKIKDDDFLS